MSVTWAMEYSGMFDSVRVVMREQIRALRQCQLKGAWYALFVTLLCVGVGLLVPVAWAASAFIDRCLAAQSEMFIGTPAGRYIAQVVLMLGFIAIGFFLMAATGKIVLRLCDSKHKRQKASHEQTSRSRGVPHKR